MKDAVPGGRVERTRREYDAELVARAYPTPPRVVRRIAGLLLAATLVAGCSTIVVRPSSWPEARADAFFEPRVARVTLENSGEATYADSTVDLTHLAAWLFDDLHRAEAFAVSHVTIDALPDGGARVSAWVGAELLIEERVGAEAWEESGRILSLPSTLLSRAQDTLGMRFQSIRLERTSDGGIVLERRSRDVGLFMPLLMPVVWNSVTWARFRSRSAARAGGARGTSPPGGVAALVGRELRLHAPDDVDDGAREVWSECLREARLAGMRSLSAAETAALGGRPTRRFLVQSGEGRYSCAGPFFFFTHEEKPRTHDLRLEKAHDLPDVVVDRFIALLVLRGYEWDDD